MLQQVSLFNVFDCWAILVVWICRHLLIHSPADGRSGCFRWLALWMMPLWAFMWAFLFWTYAFISLCCTPRSELPGHMAQWLHVQSSEGLPELLSKVAAQRFATPPMYKPLTPLCLCQHLLESFLFLITAIPVGWRGALLWFWFTFPRRLMILSIISWAY